MELKRDIPHDKRFRTLLSGCCRMSRGRVEDLQQMDVRSRASKFAVQTDSRDETDIFRADCLDWRAVCIRSGDVAIWYFIGSHADYDKLIATL